jgi:uncharacterized membrane protein YeaQ/YmgE (transglycosylase-associated protein family)
MLVSIIAAVIGGAIVGALGRLVLPGAQNIGWLKTIGVGVVASFIVNIVASGLGPLLSTILAVLVAAGLLWLAIRQNWIKPSAAA